MTKKITVYNSQGQPQLLGKPIAAGGQGSVYNMEQYDNIAVKIYSAHSLGKYAAMYEEKLGAAIELGRLKKFQGVSWPALMVYNGKGSFIGYAMKKVEGVPVNRLAHAMTHKKYFKKMNRKDVASMLLKLAVNLKSLHENGVIVGDLNLNNILVNPADYTPVMIDCDSYQIDYQGKTWHCPVARPELTAPELHGKDFSRVKRSLESEYFSFAILVFQCLMLGRYPYDWIGGENPVENLLQGSFPYGSDSHIQGTVPTGPWYKIWSHMSYKLKSTLIQTLREGAADPGKRADLDEWITILKHYIFMLEEGHADSAMIPAIKKSNEWVQK
ncbi:MAG: hypothetical protein AMXMBFR48_25060 [Ignavibacteriales bacterium]